MTRVRGRIEPDLALAETLARRRNAFQSAA
jgi:hypothetical protein